MKAILEKPDGTIAVVTPAPRKMAALMETMTEAEAMAALVETTIAKSTDPQLSQVDPTTAVIVSDESQFADRDFRNAWRKSGEGIAVDMPTARDILRDKIRATRQGKFTALDAKWMKAMATGDRPAAAAVEAKRQELRDLPQAAAIDAATTPGELRDAWPSQELGHSPFDNA